MYSLVGRKKQFTDLQMRKFKYIKMMHFHMELSFMNYLSRLAFHDIGCTGINMNCIAVRCFFSAARLEMFGSSNNGFGFRHSDLDLCMTFSDLPVPEVNFS